MARPAFGGKRASTEIGKNIDSLLKWKPDSEEEKKLLRELLLCVSIKKLDLTRINYLRKMSYSLSNRKKIQINYKKSDLLKEGSNSKIA